MSRHKVEKTAQGMVCPRCGAGSSVNETRETEHFTILRRRVCANGHKFITTEVHAAAVKSVQIGRFAETLKDRWHIWSRNAQIVAERAAGEKLESLALRYRLTPQGVAFAIKSFLSEKGSNVDVKKKHRRGNPRKQSKAESEETP